MKLLLELLDDFIGDPEVFAWIAAVSTAAWLLCVIADALVRIASF